MAASDGFLAYARHVNPALAQFLKVSGRDYRFVSGAGATLTTASGESFSDWMAGFGALNFGHQPLFVLEAIARQLANPAPNLYVEALNPFAGALAQALVAAAGPSFETCFFASSGSEAVEAALKTAMLASGRFRIAYASGGYHGTTLGSLSCMASGLYRDPFERALPANAVSVPFGDAAELERVLGAGDVAAFMLEPIQMEAGVRIAETDYLRAVRESCDRHGTLLVFDEIQTGMGRTGKLFAYQHTDVVPDLFTLGKSLGGGVLPISAAVMGEGLWTRAYGSPLKSEIHNSTFGGNALACSAALAVVEHCQKAEFLATVAERARELELALRRALEGRPAVERISLRGLLGGIQLRDVSHPWASWSSLGLPELEPYPASGALVVQRLTRAGILAHLCAHDWSVLRIEPPLTITREECSAFVAAVDDAVRWLEDNAFG